MRSFPRGVCRLSLFFFLVGWVVPVGAEVYRCPQADGSTLFSDVSCAGGTGETVAVVENSPLDSRAARENMQAYNSPAARRAREAREKAGPQVVLLRDRVTEERNARVTEAQQKAKKKKKKKKGRKGGKKAGKPA